MAWRKSPQHMIDLFDEVVPKDSRIERRKMFGYPAAFLNGHLFAGLHQENFILKLSPADREKLRTEQDARVFEPMPGRAMREYLVLPEEVLSERRVLSAWIKRSTVYVSTMPPKPGKAKKLATLNTKTSRRRQDS
jgi:TfoX/Sxy family transcriptional regulator of competence genes